VEEVDFRAYLIHQLVARKRKLSSKLILKNGLVTWFHPFGYCCLPQGGGLIVSLKSLLTILEWGFVIVQRCGVVAVLASGFAFHVGCLSIQTPLSDGSDKGVYLSRWTTKFG
jgi:hypothetical protein